LLGRVLDGAHFAKRHNTNVIAIKFSEILSERERETERESSEFYEVRFDPKKFESVRR